MKYQSGQEIIRDTIELVAGLDAVIEVPGEKKNRQQIHQSTVIALHILEKLGAKKIPVKQRNHLKKHAR